MGMKRPPAMPASLFSSCGKDFLGLAAQEGVGAWFGQNFARRYARCPLQRSGGQKMPINRLLKIGATSGDPMEISEVAVNRYASRSSPRSRRVRPCPVASTEATAKGTSESDFDPMMHSLFYDLASPRRLLSDRQNAKKGAIVPLETSGTGQ